MSNPDYLPRRDKAFLAWVSNFLKYLFASMIRFGFPKNIYDGLTANYDDFAIKLEVAEEPSTRTTLKVQAKNDSRAVLEKSIRQSVKEYLANNHRLTNEDRSGLGLPIRKTSRTPAPVASAPPGFDIDSTILRRLTIHFYDQTGKSKAKPAGQHGVKIRWVISDTPVVSVKDLINSSFDTRTPFTLEFDESQRGKTVYFCLCWENTRGRKGPWSKIQSAIIP
jgi:hypothetical protein